MMIQLAGNLIRATRGTFDFGHLQIHYQGIKFEVKAGFVFYKISHDATNTSYINDGPDFYRSTNIHIGIRNADDVWDSLDKVHLSFVANADQLSGYWPLDSYSLYTNSNSYAYTLMWSVGAFADLSAAQPNNVANFPGYGNNLLLNNGTAIPISYSDTYGDDFIRGGLRDDLFSFSGRGQDVVTGNGGNDEFVFTRGSLTIKDSSPNYILKYGLIKLKGPLIPEEDCPEDEKPDNVPYENENGVLGPDGERYRLSGGNVVVTLETGEKITVEQFTQGDFGWEFYEGAREVSLYNGAACFADPIVIDLDGDGKITTAAELFAEGPAAGLAAYDSTANKARCNFPGSSATTTLNA